MSDKNLIDQLNQTVLNEKWMDKMYGAERTAQQQELKKIFTQTQTEELTSGEKAAILSKKETLEEAVERLEAKMVVLGEELEKNQEKIESISDNIAELVTSVNKTADKLAEKRKEWANDVVRDVFAGYYAGTIKGPDGMAAEMRKRMSAFNDGGLTNKINGYLDAINSKQNEISNYCNSASNLLDQKKILESQYGITKSSYKFLNTSLENKNKKSTSYTNSDLDSTMPIYSPNKLETCMKFFDDNTVNREAGINNNYKEGTSAPSLDNIKEKYKDYFSPKDSKVSNSTKKLGEAIEKGLLNDLTSAGVHGSDLVNFFADNFAKTGIKKSSNGTITIPNGTSSTKSTFSKIVNYIQYDNLSNDTSKWTEKPFLGALNTWDKTGGNTIDSNSQIKSLSENYSNVFNEMKKGNFTFKEAMYSLFNPESGLFKDSGIVYDLKEQNGTPNYFIEFAGDNETAKLYKNVAEEIYNIWGVKPTRCSSWETYDESPEAKPTTVKRSDPLTFKNEDGTEFSFIIDRNNDGKFNDQTEFVGGKDTKNWFEEGQSWHDDLKALDKDNNGILEGEELDSLGLFGQKYSESDAISKTQTTTVDYTFMTAKDAGIEKIDLTNIENVGKSTGRTDVNNSEIFEDKFNFTMNGKELTASRKDETNDFMNAIYKDAYGSDIDQKIGFSESFVENTINDTYKEVDKFNAEHQDAIKALNTAANFDNLYAATKNSTDKIVADSENEANIIIRKGQNKAQAMFNSRSSNWGNIKNDVISAAKKLGITADDNFLAQTKGIYLMEGGSAENIVQKYQDMMEAEKNAELRNKYSSIAMSAVLECSKLGINADLDEIFEKLISQEAKTPEEVASQLAEKYGTDKNTQNATTAANIEAFKQRENEIYKAFNDTFNSAGLNNKVTDALYKVIQKQMNNGNYINDKTGVELAQEMLKLYK